MAAIDRFLPEWDANEVHETVLATAPARSLAAALAAPAAPDPLVRLLLGVRGLRGPGSIEDLLGSLGLEPLAREPDEVVFGASGRPWRRGGAIGPFASPPPGTVRIAANFRVEAMRDGRTRLSTETRVGAVDPGARRAFLRYWRVVRPFSGLIRRRWLAGVSRSLAA